MTTSLPLSGRLVNEQGIVTFILLDVVGGLDGLLSISVKEVDQIYNGLVLPVENSRSAKDYEKQLKAYGKYLKDKEQYDAMSDAMKATHGKLVEMDPVTVQINRTTHNEYARMK